MEFDKELQRYITDLQSMRERLRSAKEEAVSAELSTLLQSVADLRKEVAELKLRTESGPATQTVLDVLDGVTDLAGNFARHEALLHQVRAEITAVQVTNGNRAAVMALLSAHDQLGKIEDIESEHSSVIAGQRKNLEQTLTQLGVTKYEPAVGMPFNPTDMRSEATTVPTNDDRLQDCVAEVVCVGWQFADGSARIRIPKVRVYSFQSASPGLVVDAALSSSYSADSHSESNYEGFERNQSVSYAYDTPPIEAPTPDLSEPTASESELEEQSPAQSDLWGDSDAQSSGQHWAPAGRTMPTEDSE